MIDRRKLNTASDIEQLARNDEIKRAMKDAINEWLDAKLLLFGKWTMGGLAAAAVAALGYAILAAHGWHR